MFLESHGLPRATCHVPLYYNPPVPGSGRLCSSPSSDRICPSRTNSPFRAHWQVGHPVYLILFVHRGKHHVLVNKHPHPVLISVCPNCFFFFYFSLSCAPDRFVARHYIVLTFSERLPAHYCLQCLPSVTATQRPFRSPPLDCRIHVEPLSMALLPTSLVLSHLLSIRL